MFVTQLGWSSMKGASPAKEGDEIIIVRDKVNNSSNKIVRFSVRGKEIGRLSREVANYMSTLLDLKLCFFEGSMVYCPPVLAIGEDMILTLKCYMLSAAMHTNSFMSSIIPQAKKRSFDRSIQDPATLRKLAMIQLFRNLGMRPVRSSIQRMNVGGEDTWDMILQTVTTREEEPVDDDAADPDSEEKKEVSDGQLDTIYEKAQVFDAQIKPMDQPVTMALELKEYQKRVSSRYFVTIQMHYI
jgi:DNA repair protein RAD5